MPSVKGNQVEIDVIAQSAAPLSITATTAESILATVNVPANAMGPNGRLRVSTVWSVTNNANNKNLKVRYSGAAGTQFLNHSAASTLTIIAIHLIANRNATNSQVGTLTSGAIGSGSSAVITASVDTTAATSLVFSVQLAVSTDTATLESYLVELIPGV